MQRPFNINVGPHAMPVQHQRRAASTLVPHQRRITTKACAGTMTVQRH